MMNHSAVTAFACNMLLDHSLTLSEADGKFIEHFRIGENANLLANMLFERDYVNIKVFYGNSDWHHGDIVIVKCCSEHEQVVKIDSYNKRIESLIPPKLRTAMVAQ